MKKLFIIFSLSVLFAQVGFATNIQIENVVIVERNDADKFIIVQFDLSWDNSFRVDDGANTNWDAAWVFMKYIKTTAGDAAWGHASLHGSGHNIPGNYTGDLGSTSGVNKGIFVYPSVIFNGTATLEGMRLRWDYGDDGLLPEDEVDIRVFGVEMVYVPEGNFYAGSGGAEANHIHAGGEAQDVPFQVTNASFEVSNVSGNIWATGQVANGTFASGFPTGYQAYYVMKHSITQQAYVDFLNTLDYAQQDARAEISPDAVAGTYTHGDYRNKIKINTSGSSGVSPAIFETEHPYVANNYISKQDLLSYLDWAALRPMTELEYEKAARGPSNPVANEYAWGNTRIGSVDEVSNAGTANEATVPSGYQRDITIDHNKVDSDLTDFPIFIQLDNSNFDFNKCRADGYDLRFYDVSGNPLSYERVRHNQLNEKAEYWVNVPSISSTQNTVITMEYGSLSASDGQDVAGTWDMNNISLWHLTEESDGTAGEFIDEKGINNGEGTGVYATRVDEQLGFAQSFGGAGAISVPDDATLGIENNITVSAWVKPQALSGVTLSESVVADWNDNYSMSNITLNGDNMEVNDYLNDATRIAKPISLDAIKKVGSSSIDWTEELGYTVVAYTSDGKFTVPDGVTEIDVLVVGGGGGGGRSATPNASGGGGAGGVVYQSNYSVTAGTSIDVAIGAGGAAGDGSGVATNGENSSFGAFVANGGGAAGQNDTGDFDGDDGGSGGGSASTGGAGGTASQGNDGGAGLGGVGGAGGGGGAGSAGSAPSGSNGGNGGVGVDYSSIFGTTYGENGWFAGGGGGGAQDDTNTPGTGGTGGGGDAARIAADNPNALPNTGGGGGAGHGEAANEAGGNGGSGIVLVRYKDPNSVKIYTSISDSDTEGYPGKQIFTSDGTFTVPAGVTEVEVLVVAGGGAGGDNTTTTTQTGAGGGGGGGVTYNGSYVVTPGNNITVTVGAGGSVNANGQGGSGENSVFGSITTTGGGGGGYRDNGSGLAGGSGGGAGYNGTPGAGVVGQGFDGGDDFSGSQYNGGGGGGASELGNNANVNSAGDGGNGYASDISGQLKYYGGGGAGGAGDNAASDAIGIGGLGGGGNGGYAALQNGEGGEVNTGGGGGGSGSDGTSAGAGGSGVVIVRWGQEATNGGEIPGIAHGDDLSGKYLWVMQELTSNNPDFTPQLQNMDLEVKGEAVIAGKGEDAYQLSVYDGNLKGYINNQDVSSSLTADAYQHVAITYDGSSQRIYVNGLLTATSSLTGSINTNANNLLMGTNLEGVLAEVRLSDMSRSQAWLKAEYYAGTGDLITLGGEGTLNNAVYGGAPITGLSEEGPLRVGFGATASSSRTAAGASYWGIMNLSGNLWERTITIGNAQGIGFTGEHGTGLLNATGLFTPTSWDINGLGFRGGRFGADLSRLRISNREFQNWTNPDERNLGWGGRGVRTAP